jgi:cyclic beta-1,2-glucan synthetase
MAFAHLGEGDRAKELFDYFSPVHHSADPAGVELYKLEPYAVAADVYAAPATAGRGGWSWYTGSAAWLYRAGLESMLGFRLMGDVLALEPCVPRSWRRYDIEFRFHDTLYRVMVTNPFGVASGVSHVELDHLTILRPPVRIPLVNDGKEHSIRVVMG